MAAGIPARRSSAPATNFLRSAPESSASSSITWTSAAKATTTTITTRINTATPPMANEQRPEPMHILGINVYHPDVSAVLIRDGQLIAALEEERFRRMKHFAGFPAMAIRRCLEMGGIEGKDIDAIAISRNPRAHVLRKAAFVIRQRPGRDLLENRIHHLRKV